MDVESAQPRRDQARTGPHIVSVPIVRQGGDLIIDGQHFGAQQGNSYLVFDIDQQQMIIDHTESWSDTRIDVKLPVANTEGTVYVVRRIPLFALASNVVAYVVQAAGLAFAAVWLRNPRARKFAVAHLPPR